MKINKELIKEAQDLACKSMLSEEAQCGDVGAILITDKGNKFTGISISCACGIGFCGEASAISQMLTNKESRIEKIVAVSSDGKILPPCGRCRELIYQINHDNLNTEFILSKDKTATLKELLPYIWQDLWS